MTVPSELEGIHIRPIAAETRWQLLKIESHGGWFQRALAQVVEEQPRDQAEWLICVQQAHVRNQMIQTYGHTPHGKTPNAPSDLLNEPLHVVPATASLTEEAIDVPRQFGCLPAKLCCSYKMIALCAVL